MKITATAFRAALSLKQNRERNAEAMAFLSNLGTIAQEFVGVYHEEGEAEASREESFSVVFTDAVKAAGAIKIMLDKYEQDCILFEDGERNCTLIGDGWSEGVGKLRHTDKPSGVAYTELKGGSLLEAS